MHACSFHGPPSQKCFDLIIIVPQLCQRMQVPKARTHLMYVYVTRYLILRHILQGQSANKFALLELLEVRKL
jgi:hypothetical protein